MSNLFLKAAASYFGLGEIQPRRSELFTDAGDTFVVFELKLSDDDMMAIADRMKVMRAEVVAEPNDLRPAVGWTAQELREQYAALSKKEKSEFGSFARYLAFRGGPDPFADGDRIGELVEAAENRGDTAAADELRAGYVERTVQATDRLTGADGKPTSNATDFGGLPG